MVIFNADFQYNYPYTNTSVCYKGLGVESVWNFFDCIKFTRLLSSGGGIWVWNVCHEKGGAFRKKQ